MIYDDVDIRLKNNQITRLKFTLDETKVFGQGPENPIIEFLCIAECDKPTESVPITFQKIFGTIKNMGKKQFIINRFSANIYTTIESHSLRSERIRIPIFVNYQLLNFIEKHREGNLEIQFDFQLIYSIWDNTAKYYHKEKTRNIQLRVSIPESTWSTTLAQTGFKDVKIIEIPYPKKIKHDKFDILVSSVDKARNHFFDGNYHDCIAICRDIFDGLHKVQRLSLPSGQRVSKKQRLALFCEQKLKPIIGEEKSQLLKINLQSMWDFTSKFHHTGYKNLTDVVTANRTDAEYILFSTANILAYIMKIFS